MARSKVALEAESTPTLRRGSSFVHEYATPIDNPVELRRGPSMIKGPFSKLLPPPQADQYTIVLDLDETVIYARNGPLEVRPYFDEFLTLLNGCCEVIVWTAGVREYAKAVIRNIDKQNVIAHCIYRHPKWFDAEDYTKDLTLLGRPLDKILIVENTPDCVRNNPLNGVIVQDYEGGAGHDRTLAHLASLVQDLCRSRQPVPAFLQSSQQLQLQTVKGELGEVDVFFLSTLEAVCKEVRPNRDLQRVRHVTTRARASPKATLRKPKPKAPVAASKVLPCRAGRAAGPGTRSTPASTSRRISSQFVSLALTRSRRKSQLLKRKKASTPWR